MTETRDKTVLSEHETDEIRALIEQRSGILFDVSRERFFTTRVREHLSRKHLHNGTELLRLLRTSNVEYDSMLENLLTQETRFFRYPEIFTALGERILPEMHVRKFWQSPRALRIWSAGCSTGEEPYSIALSLCEALEFPEAWQIEILATDISKVALQTAERGLYSPRVLENLTPRQTESFFVREGELYSVKPRLRKMVKLAPMNLAQPVYVGRFDLIFCMNVLIYFSAARRKQVIQRFCDALEPGGYLILGHAETAAGAQANFTQSVHKGARLLQKPETVAAIGGAR
jgi:chemotaxis protein methyltransferase CheR